MNDDSIDVNLLHDIRKIMLEMRQIVQIDEDSDDGEVCTEHDDEKEIIPRSTNEVLRCIKKNLLMTSNQMKMKIYDMNETINCLRHSVKSEKRARMKLKKEKRRTSTKCTNALSSIHDLHTRIQYLEGELNTATRRHSASNSALKEAAKKIQLTNYEKQMLALDVAKIKSELTTTKKILRRDSKSPLVGGDSSSTRRGRRRGSASCLSDDSGSVASTYGFRSASVSPPRSLASSVGGSDSDGDSCISSVYEGDVSNSPRDELSRGLLVGVPPRRPSYSMPAALPSSSSTKAGAGAFVLTGRGRGSMGLKIDSVDISSDFDMTYSSHHRHPPIAEPIAISNGDSSMRGGSRGITTPTMSLSPMARLARKVEDLMGSVEEANKRLTSTSSSTTGYTTTTSTSSGTPLSTTTSTAAAATTVSNVSVSVDSSCDEEV